MSVLIPSDLPAVLEALGIEIDRVEGHEVHALCPMHEQRTGKVDSHPSWSINDETGVHHCFSCGYSGHIVGMVADVLDVDFNDARRWLRRAGINLDLAENLPSFWATANPVKRRKRMVEKQLRHFVEPPESAMEKRHVSIESVRHYGVLWSEKERGWVLPVRLPDGTLLGYQFKRKRVMLNRPTSMEKSSTLFGIDVFPGGRAILLESPIDCLVLHTLGIRGAVSSFGAAVSDEQMRLLIERADEIVLALDNDFTGSQEMRRLVTGISWSRRRPEPCTKWSSRIPMYVFDYGDVEEKDVGDMLTAGHRAEIFNGLRNAKHTSELGWVSRSRNSTTRSKVTATPARSVTHLTRASTSERTRSGKRRSASVAEAIANRRKRDG